MGQSGCRRANKAGSCYVEAMAQDLDPNELRALPMDERLKLIEELWDSIDAEGDGLPLPDWHRAEIDRRLHALDLGTSVGTPWDQVRRRIAGKP